MIQEFSPCNGNGQGLFIPNQLKSYLRSAGPPDVFLYASASNLRPVNTESVGTDQFITSFQSCFFTGAAGNNKNKIHGIIENIELHTDALEIVSQILFCFLQIYGWQVHGVGIQFTHHFFNSFAFQRIQLNGIHIF